MKGSNINFPWFSSLLTFSVAGFFIIMANEKLVAAYAIPAQVLSHQSQLILLNISALIILWDIRKFNRQRKDYDEMLAQLFKAKKQLQNKVHTYSGHSDKLKLFISERLLEYIQYDEKFLHFKNIAAEVRHNGVISFDKVQTALSDASSFYEQGGVIENSHHHLAYCQEAISSMRYLWDLLDLSTTDNIALHIGDHLCECEEIFFQAQLQENDSLPYQPTFLVHKVFLDVLSPIVEESEKLLNLSRFTESLIEYKDPYFTLSIDKQIEMLGNENHLRLLVDNLINNAQFYSKKNVPEKSQRPISVNVRKQGNKLLLDVYNRGIHIDDADKDKIFQLGYSTRRKKENHGKGLGLYFANNIVKGYEGNIQFQNVYNTSNTYSIRIKLVNGEVTTEIVSIQFSDDKLLINNNTDQDTKKQIEWKFSNLIDSVEIFSKAHETTHSFPTFIDDKSTITDPHNKFIPHWSITVNNRKRSSTLCFTPIDISGVKFEVSLPTAQATLDDSEESTSEFNVGNDSYKNSYDNIIELERQFKD